MQLAQTSQVVINVHVMMDILVMATAVPMSMNVKPMSVHQMPLVPILSVDTNVPVTPVMKETVQNVPLLIIVMLDSTTVTQMPHAVLMDQTLAVLVTLDSVVTVQAVLIIMNVLMVALSVTLMRLVTTMTVDTHVHVTMDMKEMANNVPMLTNAPTVHVTQTHHVTTWTADSPVHVTMDTLVMVIHALM